MRLTRQDAYALRCAISRQDIPEELPISPMVKMLLDGLDWKGDPNHLMLLQAMIGRQGDILDAVMNEDPEKDPPILRRSAEVIFVPQLPKAAELDDKLLEQAQGVGHWLNDGLKWITQRSPMTPHIFLESGLLWSVGLAIARRTVLRLDFDDIYPHLYALWIAPTTYYRKSTGLKAITQLVRETMPHLLLASQNTPEALLAKLSGQKPINYDKLVPYQKKLEDLGGRFAGQRGIIIDEATKILLPKKYLEGMAEIVMELFDAPPILERELRGEGKMVLHQPAMSFLGATTPARLNRNLADTEWEDGLLARFMLLTPTEDEVKRAVSHKTEADARIPKALKRQLFKMHHAFPEPPEIETRYAADKPDGLETLDAGIDEQALDMFNAYADALHDMTAPRFGLDERLRGNYGRFPVQAVKVALILTVMDWVESGAEGTPTISAAAFARAQQIVETHRASAHRLLANMNVSQDVKNEERIIDYIVRRREAPPSAREILRGTGIRTRKELDAALQSLLSESVIEEETRKTGGRSATTYRMVEEFTG